MSVRKPKNVTHEYPPSLFGNRIRLPYYYELDKLKYEYGEGIIRVGLNAG